MVKNSKEEDNSTFWISYADLMAGLLFVFILLIGAIVSKSIILKLDLHDKEEKLKETQDLMGKKEDTLTKNEKIILAQKEEIKENKRLIEFKSDEIKKLKAMLLQNNLEKRDLSNKIVIVQGMLNKEKINSKKRIEDYKGKVLILSNQLKKEKSAKELKEEEMLALLNAFDNKKTAYEEILEKLRKQKAQIKSLTGIKLQVLTSLKEALGDKINIDKETGSLRLASNILFGSGQSTLKANAKKELKIAFEKYIGTLVNNPKIKPHLDKIIIEGHTDSVGSYIYNLNLSQKRALAVMKYLLTLEFSKKHHIKPLMTASGRAYLDRVLVNGVEDKEASRRIEIKFRLKNEDAMQEIEKILDAK